MHFISFVGLASLVIATDPYNITVNYKVNNVDVFARVWYGDGELYVGDAVPPSVSGRVDFTAPNQRADLLYVESATPGASLPDPTFLVANDAAGAAGQIFFAQDATALTPDDLIEWFRYANLLFAIRNDRSIQGNFFLGATEIEGTYAVKWKQGGVQGLSSNAASAVDLDGLAVQLTTVPPSV